MPEGSVYSFATEGAAAAIEHARAVADGRNVAVMGGADVIRQGVEQRLVDELSLHLVPVLFGDRIRPFGQLDGGHRELETAEVIPTGSAVHLRWRRG